MARTGGTRYGWMIAARTTSPTTSRVFDQFGSAWNSATYNVATMTRLLHQRDVVDTELEERDEQQHGRGDAGLGHRHRDPRPAR